MNPIITPFPNGSAPSHLPQPVHLPLKHIGSTWEGGLGNDTFTFHGDDSNAFQDRAYGNGGFDYIRTGGGDDLIVVGSNTGTWHGTGNEIGNATIADGGAGNDTLDVSAAHGAFELTTGEGRDTVTVRGGDYVKVQAQDGDGARDTFQFKSSFKGDAQLYGVDHGDVLDLRGSGHWHQTSIDGDLAFRSDVATHDAHGHTHYATIEVMGVPASYHDAHPDILL